jgi:hypothetical protein
MDLKYYKSKYCANIEAVENFEKAKADNFVGWVCHHRLETHNSDGERRLVDITPDELITLGVYFNRPADELIFLTRGEHTVLHQTGNSYMLGHHHSETTKKKQSEANKGKPKSEEHKMKISEAQKGEKSYNYGKHWYNNGEINIRAKECPEGFVSGRLR